MPVASSINCMNNNQTFLQQHLNSEVGKQVYVHKSNSVKVEQKEAWTTKASCTSSIRYA